MKKFNKEIRDNFNFYKELVEEKKTIKTSQIFLESKRSNVHWLCGNSQVEHIKIDDLIVLSIEQSKREKKYGIKLKCEALSNEPFIRFDSDGPAHRNDDPSIPLNKQVITTPHFNTFDSNGQMIAYKTEQLLNENESTAIANDVNFGLSHFCFETNMWLNNNGVPQVYERSPELSLNINNNSYFTGVNFD